jgi:hypothetical protein
MADNWIPNEPQPEATAAPEAEPDFIQFAENPPIRVLLDNAMTIDARLYGEGKGPYNAR